CIATDVGGVKQPRAFRIDLCNERIAHAAKDFLERVVSRWKVGGRRRACDICASKAIDCDTSRNIDSVTAQISGICQDRVNHKFATCVVSADPQMYLMRPVQPVTGWDLFFDAADE